VGQEGQLLRHLEPGTTGVLKEVLARYPLLDGQAHGRCAFVEIDDGHAAAAAEQASHGAQGSEIGTDGDDRH